MIKNKKIVLIMTDTQRWDMINAYRKTGLLTPNLDRLAEDGLRCNHAYTTQPLCQPARAGIFLGQFPHEVGSWCNSVGISQTCHSVGERLEQHGVHTAYIGKWHLDGADYFGGGRCPKGWDQNYWYDMKNYLLELTPEERLEVRHITDLKSTNFSEDQLFAHRVSNRAVDFLEKYNEEDFLLVVSYDEPHGPSACPQPYASMYEDFQFPQDENLFDDMENKPEHHKLWGYKHMEDIKNDVKEVKSNNTNLYRCNSYVDYEIGRVLDAIEKNAPDCIVLYTSDHGDMGKSHGIYGKGPCFYDETAKIPFIVKGPGIPKNATDDNPVSHIDIVPTIMDIMGYEVPSMLSGKSMAAELEDPSIRTNDYVFCEFGRYERAMDSFGGFQPMRAVFDGRYKLTVNLLSSDELYDIEEDPYEMNNLIENADYKEIRNKLHDEMLLNMIRTNDLFRGWYWRNRPWRDDAPAPFWNELCEGHVKKSDLEFEPEKYLYETGEPLGV